MKTKTAWLDSRPMPDTIAALQTPRVWPAAAARVAPASSAAPTDLASTEPDPEAMPSPRVWASHMVNPAVDAAASATGPTLPSQKVSTTRKPAWSRAAIAAGAPR